MTIVMQRVGCRVVALDSEGRPSFNMLQNYGSATAPLHFFVFDLIVLNGKDVMDEPLAKRRELLEMRILPKLSEPVRYSPELKASMKDLIQSVKVQGLEGLVAKCRDSKYEPGWRLAENAVEPGAGVSDQWIYSWRSDPLMR